MPITNTRALLALTTLAALALACGGDASRTTYTVTDSAGIRIVVNPAVDDNATSLGLSDSPFLLVGVESGDTLQEFDGIVAATRLPSGAIAVALDNPPTVRVFAADGSHLRSFVRRGQGPGEVRGIDALKALTGDTLLVSGDSKFLLYSPAGELIREWPRTPGSIDLYPSDSGYATSGYQVTNRNDSFEPGSVIGIREYVLKFFTAGRDLVQEVGAGSLRQYVLPGGVITFPVFQSPMLSGAIDGRIALVRASSGSGEIRLYTPDGKLADIWRVSADPTLVDSELQERYREYLVSTAAPEREDVKAMLPALQFMDSLPVYNQMRVGTDKRVWLRRVQLPWDTLARPWRAFNSDGSVAGVLHLHRSLSPLQFGPDYLIARALDSLGVERLAVYHLSKSAGSSP